MQNRYIVIFALEGAGFGVIFYLLAREAVRSVFDVTELIPQFPYAGIVANAVGGTAVLLLLDFLTVSVARRLGLHKV
ncbi:hypothetical protein [Natrinema sp. 1APR25-10V2]|uniref:hypothetical protein n=1 Tax=Natrinema sp. 1APR25-10V2 TaxID=2951081 RepID=UPI0028765F5C|nr:hypothetical protein [Natrinema sp. 1APR25-10V2]MDS0477948.1 hypothetical protein [Natrinema sp. 1APR25-10V2]